MEHSRKYILIDSYKEGNLESDNKREVNSAQTDTENIREGTSDCDTSVPMQMFLYKERRINFQMLLSLDGKLSSCISTHSSLTSEIMVNYLEGSITGKGQQRKLRFLLSP